MKRTLLKSYQENVDYYINITQDMYFHETLISTMLSCIPYIKNKYFVITPEIPKWWDETWDEIVNEQYKDIPYENWDKTDAFDVIHSHSLIALR